MEAKLRRGSNPRLGLDRSTLVMSTTTFLGSGRNYSFPFPHLLPVGVLPLPKDVGGRV